MQEQNSVKSDEKESGENNKISVCGLIIDIEQITIRQILKLRKLMPKKEYRQLKSRKSARECRKRRKDERLDMIR